MNDDLDSLLHRVVCGDADAGAEVLLRAGTENSPALLVAAALLTGRPDRQLLARAARHAVTTRDRHLLALAAAYLDGDCDRLDALISDHLGDHPNDLLAAWIAAAHPPLPR